MKAFLTVASVALIVGTLAGCGSPRAPQRADGGRVTPAPAPAPAPERARPAPDSGAAFSPMPGPPPPLPDASSRWVPVGWDDLPGFDDDALFEAWNAWVQGCAAPRPGWAGVCAEVRQQSIAAPAEQRAWLRQRFQPHRVEAADGRADGLLTAYYEPLLEARRLPGDGYQVPLYRPPAGLGGRTWYTRQQIDSAADARAALRGREIVYLADAIDALVLHVQGSGRVRVTEPDGRQRLLRLAFAATNGHGYRSPGRWLLERGELRDASWEGIRQWVARNPARLDELLWSNPRYVFFHEEALPESDIDSGPRGAQGVPLTAGRSIAVDPRSIPYGTPVWLVSHGPAARLQRLVLAQDTGNAIVGAVRADYYAGSGPEAGEFAGRVKQPLRLWALWPR